MKLCHLHNFEWTQRLSFRVKLSQEREKQIWFINAYMWNLEKWYR